MPARAMRYLLTMRARRFDVVVVGAGVAGSAAALLLARAHRRVVLVERRALDEAGARWHNGVFPAVFGQVGLDRPGASECLALEHEWRLVPPGGAPLRASCPLWQLSMPRLQCRLHAHARRAGVQILEHSQAMSLDVDSGGRSRALIVQADAGHEERLEASLLVDASGLAAALRRMHPQLAHQCPDLTPPDLVSAAQKRCSIVDPGGARAFLARHGAEPGQGVTYTGVHGGYSTRMVLVSPDLGAVELLAGCIADRQPDGPGMLAALEGENPWIGQTISGGAGLIPIRRPYARLSAPGLILIGDAACMVFPMHGSGVAPALRAARLLADCTRRADDPGCESATWGFSARFQRTVGAVHAAYDVLRRHVQSIDGAEATALLGSGLMHPGLVECALEQRMPDAARLRPDRVFLGALRAPRTAGRSAPVLARMLAAFAAYRLYPHRSDPAALRRWSRLGAWVAGFAADPV
ncbi:MAG: FAD-dependent oxidoreductase [Deltaproteobacteria bacterium]|nr:FAD-dependent oxidoreductase [Deltaproteobacteria bacterium]